ncbi:hypothetical protein [Polluticoccus soli]|uniref:hypothetical protein n=1 Tax=Polluticoccus soli TaxID=3034150 RepID=UPI0023E0B313|nr:hypothetical protein [Flavipsychrobacter sp. JY13-12]
MLEDLNPGEQKLAIAMSKISERCYDASWMGNLEYVLWNALQNGPCTFGNDVISQQDIDQLKQMSEACNRWIYFDDETEETAIEPVKWQKKFKADVTEDPELLSGIQVL